MNTNSNGDPRSILASELDQARQHAEHWYAAFEDSRIATGWADAAEVAALAKTAPTQFLAGLMIATYLALLERATH